MTGKRRARFPALGSVVTKRIVDASKPERGEDESEQSFERRIAIWDALRDAEIDIVLCDRDSVLSLENEFSLLWLSEEAKQKKDNSSSLSPETIKSVRDLHAKAVRMLVSGVRGIDIGDERIDDVTDRARIAEMLSVAGLLADVSRVARLAQSPTPTQLEH